MFPRRRISPSPVPVSAAPSPIGARTLTSLTRWHRMAGTRGQAGPAPKRIPSTSTRPPGPTVTLTVTDNLAAAGSTSRQVTLPFQPNAFPLLYVRYPHSGPSDDQYLLYEDGTFVLQYVGGGEYREHIRGGKRPSISLSGADPRWQATGFIHGDSLLTVKYTVVMALIGFEDGVYRLAATEALALPARHGTNSKP